MSETPLHPRAALRLAVAALLAGKTTAGANVFRSRTAPFMSRELPAIGVYTTDEDVADNDNSPRSYTRKPDVVVQIVAEADAAADDVLDAISLQVEHIMLADPTWGGVADDSFLTKASTFLAEDGRSEYACHALTFRAEYQTGPYLADESSLDAFELGRAEMDLAPGDGAADLVVEAKPAQT